MQGGFTDGGTIAIDLKRDQTPTHAGLLNEWEREVLAPYQQKVLAATLAPFLHFGAAPALDTGTMMLFMAIVMRLREEIEARCRLQEIAVQAKIQEAIQGDVEADRLSEMQRDMEALQEQAECRWELYEGALHGWNADRRELDDLREKLEAEKNLYRGLHGQYVRVREAKQKAEADVAELTKAVHRQSEWIRKLEEQNQRLDERVGRERHYYSELCDEHGEALEELEGIEGVPGWMRHVAFKAAHAPDASPSECWPSVLSCLGKVMESAGTDGAVVEDLALRALRLADSLRKEASRNGESRNGESRNGESRNGESRNGESRDDEDFELNLEYEEEELGWD